MFFVPWWFTHFQSVNTHSCQRVRSVYLPPARTSAGRFLTTTARSFVSTAHRTRGSAIGHARRPAHPIGTANRVASPKLPHRRAARGAAAFARCHREQKALAHRSTSPHPASFTRGGGTTSAIGGPTFPELFTAMGPPPFRVIVPSVNAMSRLAATASQDMPRFKPFWAGASIAGASDFCESQSSPPSRTS